MKGVFLFLFLLVSLCAGAQVDGRDGAIVREMKGLVAGADFFRLERMLGQYSDSISTADRLYFQSYVDNGFNRNRASIYRIDSFTHLDIHERTDTAEAQLLQLLMDNYGKLFAYRKAGEISDYILHAYSGVLDSSERNDVANTGRIWHALEDVAAQSMTPHGDVLMPMRRDILGLWNIPVSSGDSVDDFIFDTGANLSTISEGEAKKMGVRHLHSKINVGSSQGMVVQAEMGVADSLQVGALVVRHVVFLILPDDMLYFKPVHFGIKGIIGYPVIAAMRQVHISAGDTLMVPAVPAKSDLHNLEMNGNTPVFYMAVNNNDTLDFRFDSGASQSELYNRYYERYKAWVHEHGHKVRIKMGGAGGVRKSKDYVVDDFVFKVGHRAGVIHSANVQTKPLGDVDRVAYGNIGQDVVKALGGVTLNFEGMWIEF